MQFIVVVPKVGLVLPTTQFVPRLLDDDDVVVLFLGSIAASFLLINTCLLLPLFLNVAIYFLQLCLECAKIDEDVN